MDDIIALRIDSLLMQIDKIQNDLNGYTLDEFAKSDLLVRATCFSLVQIGEQMNRLEESLGKKFPNLPWREARRMRNLIVHVYNKVDAEEVFATYKNDLESLKREFLKIKEVLFCNN